MFSVDADVIDHSSLFFRQLQDRVKKLSGQVAVGVFTDKPHITDSGSIPMNKLAAIHTEGSAKRHIPARPFIAPAIQNNRPKYLRFIATQIAPMILGRTNSGEVMDDVGAMAVEDVQAYMETGSFAPLRPATIKRKGHSKPLIDTRQLKRSITAKRDGGRDDSLSWRGM